MKKVFQIYILPIAILFLLPIVLLAQPNGGAVEDTLIPIDGGISILIAAAVVYGTKKYKDLKNNQEKDPIKKKIIINPGKNQDLL